MAAWAMRFGGLIPSLRPASDVLGDRDWLEMERIDAGRVPTSMVKSQTGWDVSAS
jgi:hypothetical protein